MRRCWTANSIEKERNSEVQVGNKVGGVVKMQAQEEEEEGGNTLAKNLPDSQFEQTSRTLHAKNILWILKH